LVLTKRIASRNEIAQKPEVGKPKIMKDQGYEHLLELMF